MENCCFTARRLNHFFLLGTAFGFLAHFLFVRSAFGFMGVFGFIRAASCFFLGFIAATFSFRHPGIRQAVAAGKLSQGKRILLGVGERSTGDNSGQAGSHSDGKSGAIELLGHWNFLLLNKLRFL
jgi:hypothetical protein